MINTFEQKDIKGFEGRYTIFSDGRIWSYPKKYRPNGSFLNPTISSSGYKMVYLGTGIRNTKNYFSVHSLVAKTFLKKPLRKVEVNHINGNKLDNRIENLEWCTRSQNAIHSHRILGNKGGQRNHQSPIKSIDEYGEERFYNSVKSASEKNKISRHIIINNLKGRSNSSKLTYFYV